jgi:nucleoside-diphosphate-sugar epimerase
MRVLVTGNLGYIGSVLTSRLLNLGHEVEGLDSGFFDDCIHGPKPEDVMTKKTDIRDVSPNDLVGFDAVIHLAGLSNDPLGALNPKLTEDINFTATMRTAQIAKDSGVKRFIYASSQSMYGVSNTDEELDEDNSIKSPVTEYAKTKWKAEQELKRMATNDFLTVSYRPSTVYGVSPRQRGDIVFNNLVGSGFTTGKISVKSDGTPWRPVVHIQDVCEAFESGLIANGEVLNGRSFNVGALGGNFTVKELANAAQLANPGSLLEFTGEHGNDSRTYKVSFKRINEELSEHFSPKWNLESGSKELVSHWKECGLDHETFVGPKFTRLEQLRKLIKDKAIDSQLRVL